MPTVQRDGEVVQKFGLYLHVNAFEPNILLLDNNNGRSQLCCLKNYSRFIISNNWFDFVILPAQYKGYDA